MGALKGLVVSLVILGPHFTIAAQKPAAVLPPSTGTVTGHVTCSDTQRFARFADVYLLPKAQQTGGPRAKGSEEKPTVMLVQGRTALDGSFTIHDLQPGEYYAIAHARGYVIPLVADDNLSKEDAYRSNPDLSKAFANFPVVHVVADRTANVELTMQRGGVIAGHALFDDGTPVSGMFIEVSREDGKDPAKQYLGGVFYSVNIEDDRVLTDDEGHYRVTALAPGKYIVSMLIWPEMNERTVGTSQTWGAAGGGIRQSFTVYSPGGFRKSEAKTVEIKRDERREDTDIEVKLGGLRTVRGRLLGGEDHHPINHGTASLKDGTDFEQLAAVLPDGTFHFNYVPEGTYELSVRDAADAKMSEDMRHWEEPIHMYDNAKQTVIVAEHDVVVDDIQLPDKKTDKAASSGDMPQ